jgi:hypothetical protein
MLSCAWLPVASGSNPKGRMPELNAHRSDVTERRVHAEYMAHRGERSHMKGQVSINQIKWDPVG